jgi:2-oxoglutarate dehydrogenase E1 component
MTPKSMLRAKEYSSPLAEFGPGTSFHRVIADAADLVADEKVRRVVLCSGKVHVDLEKARAERRVRDVAILRVEQLFPFPFNTLMKAVGRYRNAEFVWCQEEPENMGAWSFIERRIEKVLAGLDGKATRPRYVGRPESAATATGLLKRHVKEQEKLIDASLS